jgi:hypothetical protein
MGVLDDAIREHLELKRKHGASSGEVAQQEQEALGAAQRQAAEEAPVADAEPEPDVEPEPEPAQAFEDEPPVADPEPEPPAAGEDTPPRGFERVEDVDPPAEGGEEDVLEETPEFLQETPEHDRLWFEQRPPRDFDFDEDK